MSKLVPPHGGGELKPLKLEGAEHAAELEKAKGLKQVPMTTRERDDLIMMGIGAFTPLTGFMNKAEWEGSCSDKMFLPNGVFWPIPITLSATKELAGELGDGEEVALVDPTNDNEIFGTMVIEEKYEIDKAHECKQIFRTNDPKHPGVEKVMEQADVNMGGPVKVLSEGEYPTTFKGLYATPAECRAEFDAKDWRYVAALQLRNPMHRSHEYLAKIALEVSDGVFIHQLIGALKPGDIPAEVRVKCIDKLVDNYFPEGRAIQKGYPLEMRYAGPREALLHAVFRQNYGASALIVGRDHAGVGDYYGAFDAQDIFDEIDEGALVIKPLKIDWTFFCYKCESMASMKTCPHDKEDRLFLSGTMLRKSLSEGGDVPAEFSRPEVLEILRAYYASLEDGEKVEVKLHQAATGDVKKK